MTTASFHFVSSRGKGVFTTAFGFLLFYLFSFLPLTVSAEDGHRLWLRYDTLNTARVDVVVPPAVRGGHENVTTPTIDIAVAELRMFSRHDVTLRIDKSLPDDEGFTIQEQGGTKYVIRAHRDIGLLYGAYRLLAMQYSETLADSGEWREESGESHEVPAFKLRLLNHWDNLDGTIERGYAGKSIFFTIHSSQSIVHSSESIVHSPQDEQTAQPNYELCTMNSELIREYARANASIGINGSVLNNVNASPKILTNEYLERVRQIADILRPYGIKVYLSINFASPMALGDTQTADPLAPEVAAWWKQKADEIYQLVPDFGGFLVKANSEGQPGPGDYHRSHADGANMLARALKPHGGIVMWRCFVYGANHKGEDRVMQAVSEFKPLDGMFMDNVILQTKNGPLDFQPREPYSPIFDQITRTPNMVELQITQEYTGQARHLVYLGPMWQEFLEQRPTPTPPEGRGLDTFKTGESLKENTLKTGEAFRTIQATPFGRGWGGLQGIAGVANIGLDRNWCGHHFSQANWYLFGRLAWNPELTTDGIALEWLEQTFDMDDALNGLMMVRMILSREACVNYMMPLGLHHIFKFDHHMGPEPDGFKAEYPIEWCPVYYHKADKDGVGFDRTVATGTGATAQYRDEVGSLFEDINTCPEELLLWFHHVPWTYRMRNGQTLWENMQEKYNEGVEQVELIRADWQRAKPYVDEQRWREVDERLQEQLRDAREWRDVCLGYFGQFAEAR